MRSLGVFGNASMKMVRQHDGHAVAAADAEAGEAVGEAIARRVERAERDDRVPEEAEGAIAIVAAPALDEIAERGGSHAQNVAAALGGVN
jgi:hypothetical protein